jgi:hypothetical protein
MRKVKEEKRFMFHVSRFKFQEEARANPVVGRQSLVVGRWSFQEQELKQQQEQRQKVLTADQSKIKADRPVSPVVKSKSQEQILRRESRGSE